MTTWIHGNNKVDTLWHVAKMRESVGARTGTVHNRYLVTACSGRQLGGAWGQQSADSAPVPDAQCQRCAAILAKTAHLDADGYQAWGESINRAR